MIKSASQSSLTNDVKYRNMGAANVPSSEYLIETVSLTGTVGNILFENLAQYQGVYSHFKLVGVLRTDRANGEDATAVRFNGDTTATYNSHYLYGSGGTPSTGAYGDTTFAQLTITAGGSAATGLYAPFVADILDATKSTNYKVVRTLSGITNSAVFIKGAFWKSTAPITSINIFNQLGTGLVTGTRVSLYGVTE